MEEEKFDRLFLPLFDGTNFAAWKFRMKILLEEHELEECIRTYAAEVAELQDLVGDTAEVKLQKKTARERRSKKDRRCKSLLVSRIHDTQLEYIQDKQHPKDVWDALARVFERRSIASRMHLKREMLTLRLDGASLQQHFLKFDKLVREYRATGADLDELDVVCHLLLTLGPLYSTVVTAIETMPENHLSLEFVKCRLLDEETKQKGMELCTSQKDETAFAGSTHHMVKTFKCFGCKQQGHKLVDCPAKKQSKKEQKSKAHMVEQSEVCFIGVSRGKQPTEDRIP